MAEPIPSAARPDPEAAEVPSNAEDRKAAAALSSLNDNEISQADTDAGSKLPSSADQEALGKAMSRLEIVAGGGTAAKSTDTAKKADAQKKEAEAQKKKTVKVAAEDVNFLVSVIFRVPLNRVKGGGRLHSACFICPLSLLIILLLTGAFYYQVAELDLKKNKATELLQAHDADVIKAIKAFVSPSVTAN